MSSKITLIAHNIRSAHNIGSILRTADGMGVDQVFFTGYSPYPKSNTAQDNRLPHQAEKIHKQIAKTALGAEDSQKWTHMFDLKSCIDNLLMDGYEIWALEQSASSVQLPSFNPPKKIAIIIGNETTGIDNQTLKMCKGVIEIPMLGSKESYNVTQAAAIALYHIRFCYNNINDE